MAARSGAPTSVGVYKTRHCRERPCGRARVASAEALFSRHPLRAVARQGGTGDNHAQGLARRGACCNRADPSDRSRLYTQSRDRDRKHRLCCQNMLDVIRIKSTSPAVASLRLMLVWRLRHRRFYGQTLLFGDPEGSSALKAGLFPSRKPAREAAESAVKRAREQTG